MNVENFPARRSVSATSVVTSALPVALLIAALATPQAGAVNRFAVEDLEVPINSTGHVAAITADLDKDLYGFSISLEYDSTKITVTGIELGADVMALDPQWADGTIGSSSLVYGVVFGLSQDTVDRHLTPGTGRELLRVLFDVKATTATETVLTLANRTGENPVRINVMTDINGDSFRPEPVRDNGTITIFDPSPKITDITQKTVDPGDTTFIVGERFDAPGLTVTICGTEVASTLLGDGQTIEVTVPACDPGPATVEVCTDLGCDSVAGQLTYIDHSPKITDILTPADEITPGDTIFVVGDNFTEPGLTVSICGQEVTGTLLGDNQSYQVDAPSCGPGPAKVEVCNDFGCDSRPDGVVYEAAPGAPVVTEFLFNEGDEGTIFFIVGENFTTAGLEVKVCGVPADFVLQGDGQQIQVTAPACADSGCVAVEVCTNAGCDLEPEGFCYPEGTPFIRADTNASGDVDLSDGIGVFNDLFLGIPARAPCRDALDANDSGAVDLSDGVYILNFLFQGGPLPEPPFPEPGLDPTDDNLPGC